ncbi:MAG: helix-turn-helix transcriptional regulator [Terracidiphilus sp.]
MQHLVHAMNPEHFENLRLELRRGCLVLAVLAALRREQYGYTLRKTLSEHGLEIDEGTLYPLLRRLENQGLLASEWREEEKRKKRFYLLSTAGAEVLELLLAEWHNLDSSIQAILKEQSHGTD